MKKEDSFDIFDIEHFNLVLDDFDSIFEDENKKLQLVLNQQTLDSIKIKNVESLHFVVSSYCNSIKIIQKKFFVFKKNVDLKGLSETDKNLLEIFGNKIKKYLLESEKIINKCEEFLNLEEKTNNLV